MEMSEGTQLYDFIYIDDLVKAFYLIGEYGIDGTNYILGSGNVRPLKEWLLIAEKIANEYSQHEYVGLEFGKRKGDVVYLPKEAFSIENLKKDLEFCVEVTFEEGLRRTIEYELNCKSWEEVNALHYS